MLRSIDVAKFFLSLDPDRELFTKELVEKNDRKFYEGNARLNKYLHLAQNIYIAKTGKPLMDATFYAYDNGAVIPDVMEKFGPLYHSPENDVEMTEEERVFLTKFFKAFRNASIDDLIEIDHEDPAWKEKKDYYRKEDQAMETMEYVNEYRERYADMVKVLDRMPA